MKDAAYWITLAHLPAWPVYKVNRLIVKIYHEFKISIEEFFGLDQEIWQKDYELNEDSIKDLLQAKNEIANNAFLAESLFNQGYEIINLTNPEYPQALKSNLKMAASPSVLYLKGNTQLLQNPALCLLGSKNNNKNSIEFTENIVAKAKQEGKIIVGGTVDSLDKVAVDLALSSGLQCIIVLSQGITTFSSGFSKYYKYIVAGDLLVVSSIRPNTNFRNEFIDLKNTIITGLSQEIYVAGSSNKERIFTEIASLIKNEVKIFALKGGMGDSDYNAELIKLGAVTVDVSGEILNDAKDMNIGVQTSMF